MTTFRIDKLEPILIDGKICTDPSKYRTPVGMNTIIYLGTSKPNENSVKLPARIGQNVAVYSKWHGQSLTGEYIPYKVQSNVEKLI